MLEVLMGFWRDCEKNRGWSMPKNRLALPPMSSITSVATPTAWRFPIIASARSTTVKSPSLTANRKNQDRRKLMTLDAEEFIRRFLLHVIPKGFMRVRHYGF